MLTARRFASLALVAACALLPVRPAFAQKDSALGTFTVKGKTVIFKYVTVVRYTDPDDPSQHTLVIVGSDAPLKPADLRGTTLQDRAAAGTLRAVRIEWKEGFDSLTTIPYHPDLADSGQPTEGGAIIDLQRYDEQRLQAMFKSRMVGQEWQFSVRASAAVIDGGMLEPRTEAAKTVEPAAPTGPTSDATALKRALARLGYEFTEDEFFSAIQDGAIAAVDIFIELGTKGSAAKADGTPAIVAAAMACGYEPKEPRPQVIASLLKAGANPNGKDSNNATALIWAAQSCSAEAVKMLIQAGADVNARAKGGGTALVMAQALQRPEVVAVLKAAGAK